MSDQAPDWFARDYYRYLEMAPASEQVYPVRVCDERTEETQVDAWYFYQDVWAFRKILQAQPAHILDVGSTALLVGILSQFVPVTSVDVRPIPVMLGGLTAIKANVTDLPFDDGAFPLVSSLSVVEHIGLGRYGDELDPMGSERACKELQRVLAKGGRLLIAVPIGDEPMTLFNMHRLLTPTLVSEWLDECELADAIFIQKLP